MTEGSGSGTLLCMINCTRHAYLRLTCQLDLQPAGHVRESVPAVRARSLEAARQHGGRSYRRVYDALLLQSCGYFQVCDTFLFYSSCLRRDEVVTLLRRSVVDPDSLNPDPDPAFQVNPDTNRIRGFEDQKLKEKILVKFFFVSFFLNKKLQFIYP